MGFIPNNPGNKNPFSKIPKSKMKGNIKHSEKIKSTSSENHNEGYNYFQDFTNYFKIGGSKIGEQAVLKIVDAGIQSITNSLNEQTSLTGLTHVSNLGVNTSTITKTVYHIGKPTTTKIKNQLRTPLVEFCNKSLAESSKDYIQHSKRKHLTLKTGFEQKGFSFLLEDTFLRVSDLLTLFGKDKNIKQNILKNKNGLRNVYGCLYNTELNLKLSSGIDYYSSYIKIHLIKVTDNHDDVRTLVSEITNNGVHRTPVNKNSDEDKKDSNLRTKLKDQALKFTQEKTEEAIKKSNIPKDLKNFLLKERLKNEGSLRGKASDFGKINDDEQYTEPSPSLLDKTNKFSVNFDTSIRTKLTDSIQFRDRAKIIHTWHKILTPGSIWDFNLIQHFGQGIHLNYLYDIENLNNDHPVSYCIVIEHFGDRKAKLIRKKDNDVFFGYGPSRLRVEFKHSVKYLGIQKDDALDSMDPTPCVYKTKKNDNDFEERSSFYDLFTPDREPRFNVNFESIQMIEDNKLTGKTKDFLLQYDETVIPSDNLLDALKENYQNRGFKGDHLTEDDLNRSFPNENDEYEGTGGKPPSEAPSNI